MDFSFNDDEQMVHDMCARFAKEVLAEAGASADRESSAGQDLLDQATELGLFIDAIPAEQEGYLEGDYNHTLRAVRSMALAAGCPSLTMRFEANTEFALAATALKATDALAALTAAPGSALACTALEAELKPISLKSGAVTGSINSVPNAVGAQWLAVVSVPQAATPFVAIISTKTKGVKITARDGMALRSSSVGDIALTNCKATALVEGPDAKALIDQIRSSYRVLAASIAVGSALQGLDYAEEYADDRVQFGQPIGKFQSLARLIAENRGRLEAAKLLTLAAANALDNKSNHVQMTKQASDVAGQAATTAAIDAVQIYGGYGFVNDYPVEKIMRDARACTALAGDGLQEMVFDKCA